MKTKEFNEIVEMLMQHAKNTLCKKQDEYNLTEDRLDVFKKAARRQMITVPQALLGYMDKHIGSIYDYIHEDKKMSQKLAQEKIGDAINYLYLLYAVLAEEGFETYDNKKGKGQNLKTPVAPVVSNTPTEIFVNQESFENKINEPTKSENNNKEIHYINSDTPIPGWAISKD